MPDEIKDVNPDSSTGEEQVVNEPEQPTTQETQEQVSGKQETSQPQEVKEEVQQPDRPEINYAMEALRKVNELTESFKQFQTWYQQQATQPQQPQYSKAQLQAYLQQNPDLPPEQRVWALEEVDRIEKQERRREMEEMFTNYRKRTEGEQLKQKSYEYVAKTFSDCFIKDGGGNPIGWDNSHPMTRKIAEYMQRSDLKDHPEGLIVAAKLAAFDLGYTMNKQMQNKVNRTTAQLRKEQKKTLIASGGVSPTPEPSKNKQVAALLKKYQETKDPEAFKQLVKMRGLIPSE